MNDTKLVERVGLENVLKECRRLGCTRMPECVERHGDIELCQGCYDVIKTMSQYKCQVVLPFGLPGLNKILEAKGNTFRQSGPRRRSAYTSMKEKYTSLVAKELIKQGCVPDAPYDMIKPTYTWFEPHKRSDLDNVSSGAKFINDSFVDVGILSNDNLTHIQEITHKYAPSETKERHVAVSWKIIE